MDHDWNKQVLFVDPFQDGILRERCQDKIVITRSYDLCHMCRCKIIPGDIVRVTSIKTGKETYKWHRWCKLCCEAMIDSEKAVIERYELRKKHA
jgi:hypothetical protein